MSSIVEKQTVFNPKPGKVGRINASVSKPLVFDGELQSAKGSNSNSVGRNFFSDPELIPDRIFTIQSPGPETSAPVFPPSPVRLRRGERAVFLSQFTRAVGGHEILNRKNRTTGVHLFAGSKALKTHTCSALLDTGSPASFIQEKVWVRMLACGAASEDGLSRVEEKSWGGFHGTPLITSRHVRLNVHLGNLGSISRSSTVCLVVNVHIVPDTAMSTAVLLAVIVGRIFLFESIEMLVRKNL